MTSSGFPRGTKSMTTLYLTEQGVTVTKTNGQLLVRKDGKVLQELPAIHLEQIVVFGNRHYRE
jgi:CRISPR/Cas system-associated endonuclease Cas1